MEKKRKQHQKVLIIGGGASGMVAAIEAARYGAQAVLLEKENRVGKKLLATGNGRCNLLNLQAAKRHFHGNHPLIIETVLQRMPPIEVLSFFQMLGITPKEEQEGKIYPYSDQGSNVLDLLRYEMEHLGVEVHTEEKVIRCRPQNTTWKVITEKGHEFTADSLILATGGKAGSQFGASDSGYALVASLGHHCTALYPALVQMKLNTRWLSTLRGVKWQGAASVVCQQRVLRREEGELLFTEYGISGPPILQLSRQLYKTPDAPHELWVHLFPHWDEKEVEDHLMNRFYVDPDKSAEMCLVGLFHKRLVSVLLQEAGITDMRLPGHLIETKAMKKLMELCQNWKLPIAGTLSWNQAQVTAGGIDTREINPGTMASRIHPTLYITGEVMDVDGDCGGFNLYWAWATGMMAGRHAAVGKES